MIRTIPQQNAQNDVFDSFVAVQKTKFPLSARPTRLPLPRRVPYIGALAFGLFVSPCCVATSFSWAQTPLVDPVPSTPHSAASRPATSPLNPATYSIPQDATNSASFPPSAPSPVSSVSAFGSLNSPLNSPLNPATYSVPQGATNVNARVASPKTLSEAREEEINATRFSSGIYGDPAPNLPSPFPKAPTAIPPFFPANTVDATSSAARAHLETLAWAVGAWELETNGYVFQTKIDWAPGGAYLLCRDFVRPVVAPTNAPVPQENAAVSSTPTSTFSAVRVVAWNPVAGLFQSSIFCRDGSYGSGFWQREGESWRVATRILLVDGRAATSVEYFTPRQGGGFVWESTSRTVENTPLPNVGPAQTRPLSPGTLELIEKSALIAPDAPESPATQSEFE